jgi:hypothetical protein
MSSEEDNVIEEESQEEDEDEVSGLPVDVEIMDRYSELMADAYLLKAVSCVKRDENGVSSTKTRHSLQKWFHSFKTGLREFSPTHRRLISFLNIVWFIGPENLSQEFWWVNRAKLLDLTYIAMVSTALYVGSKKEDNIDNIPKCVVFVYDYINKQCGDDIFEDLADDFASLCDVHGSFCKVFSKCLK